MPTCVDRLTIRRNLRRVHKAVWDKSNSCEAYVNRGPNSHASFANLLPTRVSATPKRLRLRPNRKCPPSLAVLWTTPALSSKRQMCRLRISDTGTTIQSQTNDVGIYAFPSVKPGNYVMRVEKRGFRSVDVTGLTLYTQDQLARNFNLEVGSSSESITVTGGTTNDSPAVSMTVSREFVENMPLNGRSFQDLIQLAPGTVSCGRLLQHQWAADGLEQQYRGRRICESWWLQQQRRQLWHFERLFPFANSSWNDAKPGIDRFAAGIYNPDVGYTAEFGRNPGGQVQFTTRSGANDIHGSLFEYLRNTAFDANTWSNDHYGDPQTAEQPERLRRNGRRPHHYPEASTTERIRLSTSSPMKVCGCSYLRSKASMCRRRQFRNWASPNVQPFLNAKPLPSPSSLANPGTDCSAPDPMTTGQPDDCLFNYGYSYPNNLDNISVRVDQNLGKRLHAFVRYADTPQFCGPVE